MSRTTAEREAALRQAERLDKAVQLIVSLSRRVSALADEVEHLRARVNGNRRPSECEPDLVRRVNRLQRLVDAENARHTRRLGCLPWDVLLIEGLSTPDDDAGEDDVPRG